MLDFDRLQSDLATFGLDDWFDVLRPLLEEKTAEGAHGSLAEWREILESLPVVPDPQLEFASRAVTIGHPGVDGAMRSLVREGLLRLAPWRKGPFRVYDIEIDAEWRSDLKWDRVEAAISPLAGRLVLDVGCGNGYYAFRLLGAGARGVVGIEPTLLYVAQFEAIAKLAGPVPIAVLPLRLEEFPKASAAFDTTLSMGVLYHRREPLEHLRELFDTLKPGGELVLETLIQPGDGLHVLEPDGRYARMRNVWHLPTLPALLGWLSGTGFVDVRHADTTPTTIDEQRSTEWMPFESLAEALDPGDETRTIEGLPAPTRALVLCRRP